jgi:Signal recognition particle GTPase
MSGETKQQTFDEAELTEQNKVISLFQFIRELNKLKQKAILNVKDYPWSFAISNLPEDSENIHVFYRDRIEEEEGSVEADPSTVLLSVHKPEFQKCPEPGELFTEWLLFGWDNYQKKSSVKESITRSKEDKDILANLHEAVEKVEEEEKPPVIELFSENEDRVKAYNDWLLLRTAWVENQLIVAKTRDIFTDLYRLYFELQRESETEEIIVANGILFDYKNPNIKHPVLTRRVKLDYNADENTVYIEDTDVPSELYSIVFQMMDDVNLSAINTLSENLQKNDYHPLDRNDTPGFLKILVHQLSSSSLYSDNGVPDNWSKTSRLLLYLEPCYIVRKRLDGTLKAIEQIIENVQETGEVPAPIGDIVSGGKIDIPEDTGEETIEEQLAAVGGESVDILLSKEANKEQLEIANRIEHYNAVLVQGPPGTGKTHTIANLMGHFLAQGKSVLVTSYTKKALNILKEKVTPGLQNLCVSILDDSIVDMEKSIDGITDYMSGTTSHEIKKEMDLLAVERRQVIENLATVRRKIFEIINKECNCIVYNGEDISPTKAAEFVVEHMDDLSYIPGTVRLRAPLPLTFEQLANLYRSNEGVSEQDETELANDLPEPSQIMAPSDYEKTWTDIQASIHHMEVIGMNNSWSITNDSSERRISIVGSFGNLQIDYPSFESVQALKNYISAFGKIEKWMKCAAVDGKNGGSFKQRWITLVEQIHRTCEYAESLIPEQFGKEILFVNSADKAAIKPTFEELRDIFAKKGKVGKLTLLMHKDYGPVLESVTINEKQVQSAQDCDIILHCIELDEIRAQCAVYWNSLLSGLDVPEFADLDQQNQERIAANWIPNIKNIWNGTRLTISP